MSAIETMDHDDDVERLFSWLQTPELRYREFAGAREVTDKIPSRQAPRTAVEPEPPQVSAGAEPRLGPPPRALVVPQARVPAVPPMPESRQPETIAPTVRPHEPEAAEGPSSPTPAPPPAASDSSHDPEGHGGRSLDAVFSRLAGTRRGGAEPRERRSHIPGLGPQNDRPR